MSDLTLLPAYEIVDKIETEEISAVDVCRAYWERIDRLNELINGYVYLDREGSMKQAEAIDAKVKANQPLGLMAGVPVAIKDNISEQGKPLSSASNILGAQGQPYHSPYNAFVIDRLLAEDAVILGRTNMDEFAMGSSTETSALGVTKNPWDLDCVPGGSSGGSAAVVTSRLAAVALGSDTGGSIRQPASFCGTVGLKPIYGEVSRFGLAAFASSLDQIGPFTRHVHDAALLMQVIAGHDPQDATSIQDERLYGHYLSHLESGVEGMKIGIPQSSWSEAVDDEVQQSLREAKELLERMGATVEDVELPHSKYAVSVYYIIATAEASSNLARYDGVQYGYRYTGSQNLADMYCETRDVGFGAEVKRRILLGTYVLSSGYYDAYYKKAQRVRTLIKRDYQKLFTEQGFDALMLPTSPTPAFRMGSKTDDPLQMYLSDIFTISINLAGLPGISIPSGLNQDGLPLSVQLVTDGQLEQGLSSLFRVAATYEKELGVTLECSL